MTAKRTTRAAPSLPRGPRKAELLKSYQRATGIAASPRATNSWLNAEIAAARSRYNANRVSAAVQAAGLAVAAAGTYRRVRAEQAADPGKRSMGGDTADRLKAAGAAAIAVAPGAALTMAQGTANVAAALTHTLPLGLQWHSPVHAAFVRSARAAGRAVLPALAAWSMHREALADPNALRGAGRGLVRALDPSSLVLGKGLAERGYDKAFGALPEMPTPGFWDRQDDPRFQRQPNAYERFGKRMLERLDSVLPGPPVKRAPFGLELPKEAPSWPWPRRPAEPHYPAPSAPAKKMPGTFDMGGAGHMDERARARASAMRSEPSIAQASAPHRPAAASYKDTWTDKNGKSYTRRDLSVRTG